MNSDIIDSNTVGNSGSQLKWASNLVIRYGLMTAGLLILFFIAMRAIGLEELIFLHVANLGIFLLGAFYFFRAFFRRFEKGKVSYLNGLLVGSAMSAVASLFLGVFMFFALQFFSPNLGDKLLTLFPLVASNFWMVAAVVVIEGCFFGFLATLINMQWYK